MAQTNSIGGQSQDNIRKRTVLLCRLNENTSRRMELRCIDEHIYHENGVVCRKNNYFWLKQGQFTINTKSISR